MSAQSESEDRVYYSRRANEELIRAATCDNNATARAHLNLAKAYQERVAELAGDNQDTGFVLRSI